MSDHFPTFEHACSWATDLIFSVAKRVDAGKWQGIRTEAHPSLVTREVLDLDFAVPVDHGYPSGQNSLALIEQMRKEIQPSLPWADDHFYERVGGKPLNPDPSHERWPWWRGQDSTTKNYEGEFTHTYSERFWPKQAGMGEVHLERYPKDTRRGIRFAYGDLNDVVVCLWQEPMNRQAYLPIFFPEDTGAVHGGRIPCTLGYHFLLRDDRLHMWYDIRSCDAVRHFRDDLYLAVRLQLWMLETLQRMEVDLSDGQLDDLPLWSNVKPGMLYFKAHSFHVHMGDIHHLLEDK